MMEKQMAIESEGLRRGIGGARGVTDESGYLVEDFKPTQYELEVLARHYLKEARHIEFLGRFLGLSDSYGIRMRPFAYRRLATIENVLGEKRFRKAIASTEEECDRRFTEAEEIERNLEPCKTCGGQRDYGDYASSHPDTGCGECANLVILALGRDRFDKAIASGGEDWHRAFAEAKEFERKLGQCKTCGRKLDIYDYHFSTPYCRPCYSESDAPEGHSEPSRKWVGKLTDEDEDMIRQWVEENERRTEDHISRLKEGSPDDRAK